MEKTIKIQRWAIFILLFVIGLCGWAIIILGRFLYVQTLNQISALPPTPLPTSTQAPPPARSPTSQFKQVIYSVDTFIDENNNGVWDDNENVYLCPDKEAHSQWESTQETVDANGDVIITIHDLFPLPICPPESPTG